MLPLAAATLAVFGALVLPAAGDAAAKQASGAHPVRACGTLVALGRTLRIDIADGRLPITCARARGVIRHYLTATRGRTNGKLRHNGQPWACYRSRKDRIGWDFHCTYIKSYVGSDLTKNYIDVGAGRR
jgi:hypothetical protein